MPNWIFCSTWPLKILSSVPFGIQSNSILGISELEILAFSQLINADSAYEISVLRPNGIQKFGIQSNSVLGIRHPVGE
jgi:hypothetical protein